MFDLCVGYWPIVYALITALIYALISPIILSCILLLIYKKPKHY